MGGCALAACGGGSTGSADAAGALDAPVIDARIGVDAPSIADAAFPDGPIDAPIDASIADAGPLGQGVTTLAGSGEIGLVNGFRSAARFSNPANVAVGADGTIYVADFDNGVIRAVTDWGDVTTLTSQGGFARPFGLVRSSSGVLYAQTDRNTALMNGGALWSIDTTTGLATLLFDNIGRCRGLAELPDGRLVLAFYQEHVLKVYDPATPAVAPTVIAGTIGAPGLVDETGAAARFNLPYDVIATGPTEVVVSDLGNHVLRKVDVATGVVTTFAGDGTAATLDNELLSAQFNSPQGLAIDGAGTIYVSELGGFVLRRISGGNVATLAGDGTAGHLDNVNPLGARFFGLEGIDVHPDGTLLYVADGNRGEVDPYNRVRRVTLP